MSRSLGALPAGCGRDAVVAEVRRALAGLGPGLPVGVATSGGPDSVALAGLVAAARPDLAGHVLHVRHGLRDDAADARAAAACAAALGWPFVEQRVRVEPAGDGLEAAARDARLAALARTASERGLRAVLLGHTADDQAETVLLNLGRGSGLAGLAGMAAERTHGGIRLLRPLLRLRRADVRGVGAAAGWGSVDDPMNHDPARRRTRARNEVLPALASLSGGPGDPVGVLARLADLVRDDAVALDQLAAGHAARLVRAWGPVRAVRSERLARLPAALARRVVRGMLAEVRGGLPGLPAAAVETALGLRPGGSADVAGGVRVSCGCGWLAAAPPGLEPLAARPLTVPGTAALPELGLTVHADLGAGRPHGAVRLPPRAPRPAAPGWASVPAPGQAAVRGWRAGDRIRTARGEASVADLLARAEVPRPMRPLVPVVVDPDDRPVWVAGVAGAPRVPGEVGGRVWLSATLG